MFLTMIIRGSFKVCLAIMVLAMAGCTKPRNSALTTAEATSLALQLANEKAQALYQCRPYRDGPVAQLVDGCWVWHARRGQGQVDLEATVKFSTNGAEPNVTVVLLDNLTGLERPLRR